MEYFNYTGKEYTIAVQAATLYPVIKVELLDQYENAYIEISEEITDKEIKNYIEKISNEVDEIIELSCGDAEKYYYDFDQEDW